MKRSQLPRISETEWEVMKVIWAQAPCTAGEFIELLTQADPAWHPKTVKAFLNRLGDSGFFSGKLVGDLDAAGLGNIIVGRK